MHDAFDPYQKWLGIPPSDQPPHYYRLLGLPIFFNEVERIRAEADQRMQHVRTFQLGKRAQASQEILNELASARVCLLSPESKARYDAALAEWLAAKLPVPPPVLPPEAPPLLQPQPRSLLPGEETVRGAAATSSAAAFPQPTRPRRPQYTGWLIIACVVMVTIGALVVLRIRQRPQHGTLEDVADVQPTTTVPEVNESGSAHLGGKTVTVPSEVVQQDKDGNVRLPPDRGRVTGPTLKLAGETTADWRSKDDRIAWQFLVSKPGIFRVVVTYAADASSGGGEALVSLSGRPRPLTLSVRNTGGSESFVSDELSPMVRINKADRYSLTITAAQIPGGQLMALRGVEFRRAPVR